MHGRGLYVQMENETTIDILMVTPEGKEKKISEIVPAQDLLNAVEMDYSVYRKRITQLQDLPLFQEKLDIAMAEYEELVNAAKKIPNLLEKIDPVGAFVVRSRIALKLQIPDDGTASFWLYSGQRIFEALMEPVLTQLRLRNIFEVTFGNTERATQAERYKILRETYPQLFGHYFRVRHLPAENGDMPFGKAVEYAVNTLLELRMLELEMYFRQPNRIARCAHCWGYFMPKTKKETMYCDRTFGEKPCKQLGPNAQRRIDQRNDNALAVFEVLRHRMEARYERYMDSSERMNTNFVLNIDGYFDWSDSARQTRMNYLDGKITAEEFIRRIDIYGELSDFTLQKTAPDTGESALERKVRQDLSFDPSQRYFDIQMLDLGKADPQWKTVTAEERLNRDKGTHRPLAEQAEDLPPKKPE